MIALPYDILKKDAAELVWIEAVRDLATAKVRIKELAAGSQAEYVVFDQRTRKIVFNLKVSGGPLELF
ncbi:MAG TPA: hypothetical protein VKQ28_02860 [Candidatus Acidoferrum sp.]|nr:hypothetical protein [Candidatus Acidoferrum sp.]